MVCDQGNAQKAGQGPRERAVRREFRRGHGQHRHVLLPALRQARLQASGFLARELMGVLHVLKMTSFRVRREMQMNVLLIRLFRYHQKQTRASDEPMTVSHTTLSHVIRHTSHVTRHTSHVTRHTSHVLRCSLHATIVVRRS